MASNVFQKNVPSSSTCKRKVALWRPFFYYVEHVTVWRMDNKKGEPKYPFYHSVS